MGSCKAPFEMAQYLPFASSYSDPCRAEATTGPVNATNATAGASVKAVNLADRQPIESVS